MTEIEENVLATIQRMTEAFHDGDLEGIMKTYGEGAVVVFEPGQPVRHPAVQREIFQSWFAIKPHFQYSGHEVFVAGDTAVHVAPWSMKGRAPDGTDIEQSGLSIAVLRRRADGRWLMVIDDPHGDYLLRTRVPGIEGGLAAKDAWKADATRAVTSIR